MKRKILLLSALVAILIILGGLSPSICSKDIKPIQINNETDTVTVEVNKYYGRQPVTIETELTLEEVKQLEVILKQLDEAMENNDEATIKKCESIINEKGIFGDEYEEFYSHDAISNKMQLKGLSRYSKYLQQNGDNLSNLLCYFHAAGEGMLFFWVEISILQSIYNAIQNASSFIEAFIILFALLPFYVLGLIMTHIIPFRILMPKGIVRMDDGKITSIGLKGFKKAIAQDNESIMVNVSLMTGITISWPVNNQSFLFVSGFAARVSESNFLP